MSTIPRSFAAILVMASLPIAIARASLPAPPDSAGGATLGAAESSARETPDRPPDTTAWERHEEMSKEFTIETPKGWQTRGGNTPYGVVIFAGGDLGRQVIGAPGEIAISEQAGLEFDSGRMPGFMIQRRRAGRGETCEGLSEKRAKELVREVTDKNALGRGHLLAEARVEPISFGACHGIRVGARWRSAEGAEYAMDLAMVSSGKTLYMIGLRNRTEFFDRNRPGFDRALSTFRLASTE